MGEYDAVFEAMSERHRRQLLVEMLYAPQRIPPLSGTARELLDADEELLREQLASSGTIHGVDDYVVSLHCLHLPKLVEDGLITWHRDDALVTQGPLFDQAKPFLELLVEQQDERGTRDPVVTFVDGI